MNECAATELQGRALGELPVVWRQSEMVSQKLKLMTVFDQ